MANSSLSYLQGNCLAPFLDASRFPDDGGYTLGRFCAPIYQLPGTPTCCLPCPATAWSYSDSFDRWMTAVEWLNVVGLILLAFMLISYAVLPVQQTRSHYLSVCLIVAVGMIAIGFTIPLGAQPQECYNEITPNDMYSLTECAWSGAFIVAGALSTITWVFIRALSMNLQICWDIVPGRRFFYLSQAFGWGVPAVLFTATMVVTGVSFRFGKECDVNHENSMGDFWGPLMALAGAAGLLQLVTFGYCLRVYLSNLFNSSASSSSAGSSTGLPSHSGSVRTQGQAARIVWRRLKKVLWLQWRGIAIVTVILVDVIFFAIVFVWLDRLQDKVNNNFGTVEPWLQCLALHPTDKEACLSYVSGWLVNQPTVVAVLIMISLGGVEIFLFVARPSLFPAWLNLIKTTLSQHQQEFVSLDARPDIMRSNSVNSKAELIHYRRGHESTAFEMQSKPSFNNLALDTDLKTALSPTYTELSSPSETHRSPIQTIRTTNLVSSNRDSGSSLIGRGRIPPELLERMGTPDRVAALSRPTPVVRYDAISLSQRHSDYFDHPPPPPPPLSRPTTAPERALSTHSTTTSERRYNAPPTSFSAPQAPPSRQSSTHSTSFDPRDTYSRGGGGGGGGGAAGGGAGGFGGGGSGLQPPREERGDENSSGSSSCSEEEDLERVLKAQRIW